MSQGIALHQALHGYADGHQLLASSARLSREQEAQLLVMSDLSGPSFRAGFESYLTGYPLSGGGYYCFARTWYATELRRPGCVWTHTILVAESDIPQIADFRSLLPVMRRPASAVDLEAYVEPLPMPRRPQQPDHIQETIAAQILLQLYGSARVVVLISETAERHEALVLAILSQQWPRLRRGFRFCTGALALRNGTTFDLAVAPPDVARHGDESRSARVVDEISYGSLAQTTQTDEVCFGHCLKFISRVQEETIR